MTGEARRTLWGVAIAAAYVAVVLLMTGAPSRPLFDVGGGPAPYKWSCPPTSFAATNQPPLGATHQLPLAATGTAAASVSSNDGQAAVVFKDGSFPPHGRDRSVEIKIAPSCPDPLGPPPPGLRYDGNAYMVTATNKSSGAPAELKTPATVVLQFPILATTLLRRDGNAWTDLKATPVAVSLQIFQTTDRLGLFVTAGPPVTGTPRKGKNFPAAIVISAGAALAAVVAGLIARRRARSRSGAGPAKRDRRTPQKR